MVPVLGAIAFGSSLISGALKITGQIKQGNAEKKAADYNAGVLRANADLIREEASENERRLRIYGEKSIGKARTAIGASGVAFEGSVMDVLAESAANIELDALTIREQGERQAKNLRTEAFMVEKAGKTAQSGSRLAALGSGLAMATDAYTKAPDFLKRT